MNSVVNFINQINLSIKNRSKFFICSKSKLNISILNLLITQGFILNFFQFKFLKNKLCVYHKYYYKKPIVKKIKLINRNIFVNNLKRKGDLQTNVFYVMSTSLGGFFLLSFENCINSSWYSKFGGKILFKIII